MERIDAERIADDLASNLLPEQRVRMDAAQMNAWENLLEQLRGYRLLGNELYAFRSAIVRLFTEATIKEKITKEFAVHLSELNDAVTHLRCTVMTFDAWAQRVLAEANAETST